MIEKDEPKMKEILNTMPTLNPSNSRISWDDYFSILAIMTALRSSDKHRKVGAVIVSQDNRILSAGYNGAPIGIQETDIPWNKKGDFLDTKYPYIVHAELNAILGYNNDKSLLKGAKIYTTLFPCNNCMKAIIQSGITEVIYLDNHSFRCNEDIAARYMVRVHNQNTNYPPITLRAYEITASYKPLVVALTGETSVIIPLDEVKKFDEKIEISNCGPKRNLTKQK